VERSFFFEHAFLPGGWRRNVRLESQNGRIVSARPDVRPEPQDRRERIAVPGLPNLHSHAFQRAMAGLAERRGPADDNFWSWREAMYRFVRAMGPDEVQAIAAYAYADMLEAGFTTVGEFHYVHRTPDGGAYADPAELALRHVAAAEETGLGMVMLPVFYAASTFGGAPPTSGQKRFIADLDAFADIVDRAGVAVRDSRLGRGLGIAPHSLRAVPPQLLTPLIQLKPEGPLHIHAAEQVKEVEDCLAWSGLRPVEWLLERVGLDPRWCLVHATHLTEDETRRLAASGAAAGLCPITEGNLGDGTFPAVAYLEAGGRFGVGTDSNIQLDAAGELRQLEYSQRLTLRARNVLAPASGASTGQRLLEAALEGGAQALGLGAAGLRPGAPADFVVLDALHTDLATVGEDNWLDAWIFALGRRGVDKVVVSGEIVVDGGRHRARDAIDARYRAAVAKLSTESVS
jgi:formiminoglutamate deiminase